MEFVQEVFSAIKDMLMSIWEVLTDIVPIAFKFILWVLLGLIVLPCVFIAGTIYPMWADWGEKGF